MFKILYCCFFWDIFWGLLLPTNRMAERKMKEIKSSFSTARSIFGSRSRHSPVFSLPFLCTSVLLGFNHFGVDFIKVNLLQNRRSPKKQKSAKYAGSENVRDRPACPFGFSCSAAYLLTLNGINAVPSGFVLTFCKDPWGCTG